MKNRLLTTSIALLALCLGSRTASAKSPERIAHRCAEYVNGIVDRCRNAAADETQECVQQIRELLAEGRYEAARELAHECIRHATARTDACVDHVIEICRRCIDVLLDLGEPQLARRVANVCEDAIDELRHILEREKHAILAALDV